MMYGMVRTTVYLPEASKAALERIAAQDGCTEAELIRRGVQQVIESRRRRTPRVPLFRSSDPTLAERVDEHLQGFGEG